MSTYQESACSTTPMSVINGKQVILNKQLEELLEIAKQVSQKIEPVMISSSPTPMKEDNIKMPEESKLGMDLESYINKVIDIQKVLKDCLSRIQL